MSLDRESAWQAWKAREARYRESSMTDLRQAFEAGWEALVRPVDGVILRRCSWEECPGLEKSIPMHEQEDGPELHDVCKAAMIAPEAVAELTSLYQQLAHDRKDHPAEGTGLNAKEALLAAEALRFQAATTGHLRPTKAHVWRALAARLEASS